MLWIKVNKHEGSQHSFRRLTMTATPNNIILTKDGTQITIGTTSVEQVWNKTLTPITTPKTAPNQGIEEGANTTKIVDLLLKAEKRLTVSGYVSKGLGSGDTNSAAYDKKEDLKKVFFAGGVITMNWEGVDYTINMEKCTTNWKPSDGTDEITKYPITFTALEGIDL